METWAIVALVLGASVISALMTFFITKMQVRYSDRRFERELERAIVMYHRERRREARSEPLLKLRSELARMGNKQDKLVNAAHRQLVVTGGTEEERKKELQGAVDDWNDYMASGDYGQTLFMQYDIELINKAVEILKDYQESYFSAVYYKQASAEELKKSMKVFKRNKVRIIEVQELINKRLEEL